ncbi:hypothetical protein [Sphingobacterium composti Ten et al. 2007 non Yoo et al. 2007]|jgi:hypothetical protein|uniref:hypothetical protein n=1 Tax=Sphingobacterium composti TaxID=363260 RepID=UPI00135C3FE6|nr:hypothetical protein [Sphingobacterium composti Ten et al. 2007 non Yoo et al. 2007]
MLLSNYKSSKEQNNNSVKSLAPKLISKEDKLVYQFVFANKHFYTGSHKSLSILRRTTFLNHCKNLSKKQLITLALFFKSLNEDGVKHISEVRTTKTNKLNYVTAIFEVDGKTYTENIFTFSGFNKLVSYRGIAKYNLSLNGLLETETKK